ncbi:uncharacterized protein N7443_005069 [Penicillium atrosanguineum]|uniref:uncharacterized protein n=1 Tax=Penicillium atrosanguineum TaxID=1132637 RepID=UPI00239D0600|nr:uncharacterized protein N7443_005069 [Penicillium atrosanguineum]KAJ5305409.1 hypothetical protein N7443_005069 [Penicillium atrosanguineum]
MASLPALRLGKFALQRPVFAPAPRLLSVASQLRMASNAPTPRFAEGEDSQQLGSDTAALQQQGWALDTDGMGVTKTFHFKSYFKAVVSSLVESAIFPLELTRAVLREPDRIGKLSEEAPPYYDCGK